MHTLIVHCSNLLGEANWEISQIYKTSVQGSYNVHVLFWTFEIPQLS